MRPVAEELVEPPPSPEPEMPEVEPEPPKKRGQRKKEPTPKRQPKEPEAPKPKRGRPKKGPAPEAPKEPKRRPKKEPAPEVVPELSYEGPTEHLAMLLHQHTEDAKTRRREQMRNLLGRKEQNEDEARCEAVHRHPRRDGPIQTHS